MRQTETACTIARLLVACSCSLAVQCGVQRRVADHCGSRSNMATLSARSNIVTSTGTVAISCSSWETVCSVLPVEA